VTPDPRVKALILLAPATPWFVAPGALHNVHVPILMFTGDKDIHVTPWYADVVKIGLPDESLLTHVEVPNAGHYSFLGPYPVAMISPSFPPSQDPEGFNREEFHQRMNAEIVTFLNRALPA
jgi:predicted dienelactone hydrolase